MRDASSACSIGASALKSPAALSLQDAEAPRLRREALRLRPPMLKEPTQPAGGAAQTTNTSLHYLPFTIFDLGLTEMNASTRKTLSLVFLFFPIIFFPVILSFEAPNL